MGSGRDRGQTYFPTRTAMLSYFSGLVNSSCHCWRLFIKIFPASLCFIESTCFVINVAFNQLALNSSIHLGDFLTALRPQSS